MPLFLEDVLNDVAISTGITTRKAVTVAGNVPVTAGGALGLGIGPSTGPNIYTGSGAPTVSAPKGSLYLRTDGSSVSTRAYINTDGATTWTPITTVA
jgi:hypothetical protein